MKMLITNLQLLHAQSCAIADAYLNVELCFNHVSRGLMSDNEVLEMELEEMRVRAAEGGHPHSSGGPDNFGEGYGGEISEWALLIREDTHKAVRVLGEGYGAEISE